MEDVSDANVFNARDNFLKWEDIKVPLAQLATVERDTVIELMSVSGCRPYPNEISDNYNSRFSLTANSVQNLNNLTTTKKDFTVKTKLDSTQEFLKWFGRLEDEHGLHPHTFESLVLKSEGDSDRCQKGFSFSSGSCGGSGSGIGSDGHNDGSRLGDGVLVEYVGQLNVHKSECQVLLQQLDNALQHLNTLKSQYTSVSRRTSALHTDCEQLLAEQTHLSNTAEAIDEKLCYFTQVNAITHKLTSPLFSVTNDGFIPLLAKIDQCISYMKNNSNYKESAVYLARYMHCLSRALSLIRTYVTRSLESATRSVIPKSGEIQPNSDDASVLYYSKFRTNAPKIKSLMSEIEDRIVEGNNAIKLESSVANGYSEALSQNSIHNQSVLYQKQTSYSQALSILYNPNQSAEQNHHLVEYQNLLNDCHQCYFRQRQQLLGPCVTDAVNQLVNNYQRDHCSLVRSGCAFLVHVCEDEHALFHRFFSVQAPELDVFLEGLCTALYDSLRPLIIHIDHLETLAELCSILRRGLISQHLAASPRLGALGVVVGRMLEDVQERLVHRAHVYVAHDIRGFVACPGDLAYPGKLELMEQISREVSRRNPTTSRLSAATAAHGRSSEDRISVVSLSSDYSVGVGGGSLGVVERFSRVGGSPADLHGMWYPTLRRTLMCLSKLYRCVDRAIFQGVSLEAVEACLASLQSAANAITTTSGPVHGALFQIKHLLILREQLAPFQVESILKETSLDWSKLKDAAYGLVQQRRNLFSLSTNNALLQFIVDGTPQVTEQVMDSKRDVDDEVKRVCERLMSGCGDALVAPLTAWLQRAAVVLAFNTAETVKPIQLKNQPFAHPLKIGELVSNVTRTVRTELPKLLRNLQLYLANRDTEFILLKPVRLNVANSFAKLAKIISENYNAEDTIIASCPTTDEINIIMNTVLEAAEERRGAGGDGEVAAQEGRRAPKTQEEGGAQLAEEEAQRKVEEVTQRAATSASSQKHTIKTESCEDAVIAQSDCNSINVSHKMSHCTTNLGSDDNLPHKVTRNTDITLQNNNIKVDTFNSKFNNLEVNTLATDQRNPCFDTIVLGNNHETHFSSNKQSLDSTSSVNSRAASTGQSPATFNTRSKLLIHSNTQSLVPPAVSEASSVTATEAEGMQP